MGNGLRVFESAEFGSVRTMVDEEGNILFCGSDVATALGYVNPSKALGDHCKGITKRDTLTNGGKQALSYIPEGDMYRLVFGSKLPDAEKFTDWVTDEILPALRKTGHYDITPVTREQQLAQAFIMATQVIDELKASNARMLPKAEYFDALVERRLLTNFRDTAKEFHMKQTAFINWLLEQKFVYRDTKGKLLPYAEKNDGLFELKESKSNLNGWSGVQTLITPKGRETFRLLLSKGVTC